MSGPLSASAARPWSHDHKWSYEGAAVGPSSSSSSKGPGVRRRPPSPPISPQRRGRRSRKAQADSSDRLQEPNRATETQARGRAQWRDHSPQFLGRERGKTISKALSGLLRHTAAKEGLTIRKDGLFRISELVNTPKLRALRVKSAEIGSAISTNAKQRFELVWKDGEEMARAVQGHSV